MTTISKHESSQVR